MINNSILKERHVVLICDDAYVMPTMATIKSLISNLVVHENFKYVVDVCTFGINSENVKLLKGISNADVNVAVHIINKEDYKDKIQKINQRTHVTPTALLKFELANIFPDADKVLYLDSDIIVKGNIAEIFEINISDYYIAASYEFWAFLSKYWDGEKCNPLDSFYFNSGVLLMNLEKMRFDNIPMELWETKFRDCNNSKKELMDQDTLNKVCGKKALPLSIKWNFNTAFSRKVDINLVNYVYNEDYKDCDDLIAKSTVIHYVGKEDKPWKYKEAKCRQFWDYYYEQLGYKTSELNLIKAKHSYSYYLRIIGNLIKKNGICGTSRYILYKISNRK